MKTFDFIRGYLEKNFDSKLNMVDGYIEQDTNYESVRQGICPICKCKDKLLMGPEGGGAIDIKCDNCQAEFCVPLFAGFTITRVYR